MKEYKTVYHTVADDGTFTVSGRVGRTITLVHLLINGTGVETVDASLVYNTKVGDAIVAKPLAQVTSAAGAPTLIKYNDPLTTTFPITIGEDETLVFTCVSSAAGAMYFAVTTLIES